MSLSKILILKGPILKGVSTAQTMVFRKGKTKYIRKYHKNQRFIFHRNPLGDNKYK